MATPYKIKVNGKMIAQADRPAVAAYLALSYNAEVNYDNRSTVWNPKKESKGWLAISQEAIDELAQIITERVEKYTAEADARYYKKMEQFYKEREAAGIITVTMTDTPGEGFKGTTYTITQEAK